MSVGLRQLPAGAPPVEMPCSRSIGIGEAGDGLTFLEKLPDGRVVKRFVEDAFLIAHDLTLSSVQARLMKAMKLDRKLQDPDRRFLTNISGGQPAMRSGWSTGMISNIPPRTDSKGRPYASDEPVATEDEIEVLDEMELEKMLAPRSGVYNENRDYFEPMSWLVGLQKSDVRLLFQMSVDGANYRVIGEMRGRTRQSVQQNFKRAIQKVWNAAVRKALKKTGERSGFGRGVDWRSS